MHFSKYFMQNYALYAKNKANYGTLIRKMKEIPDIQ